MQPTSPLPGPQFWTGIVFASKPVAWATLYKSDFLSHHKTCYRN